jgi:hypothetical protein
MTRIVTVTTLFTLLLAAVLFPASAAAGGGTKPKFSRASLDSLRVRSHERYFEEQYRMEGAHPMMAPPPPSSVFTSPFPNIDLSRDASPQNEPSVRISHKNPNRMVAAWRDFRTGSNPAVRRVGYTFSTDAGLSWSDVLLLPQIYIDAGYTRHSDPAVCVDTAGDFYIATIALNDNNSNLKVLVFKSNPLFDEFDQAYFVPSDTAPNFYDKEYIECDLNPASPFVNNLYIVWSGPNFSRSTDAGVTWSSAIRPGDPNIGGNFAPDLCVAPDGGVCTTFLGGNIIEFDRSTDGGVSFGYHTVVDTLGNGGSVNPPGFTSIAADLTSGPRRGWLYVTWADNKTGDLDVFLSASRDNGLSWSAPRRVNNDTLGNGKEQFWPWIAVDDRGVISIVYSDTRNTPSLSIFETYLAYSWDGGITFTNRLISTAQSTRNTPNGDVRFGDYIGLDSWGKHTVPVWTDERFGGFDMSIYTATLDTLPLVTYSGVTMNVRAGWNMLSLPVLPSGIPASLVFPGSAGVPIAYTTAYEFRDTIRTGLGYWVRYASDGSFPITGDTLSTDTVEVTTGWNLIGSVTRPVATGSVTSDPPAIMTSGFFGYNGSYVHASTIEPGKAYWVKVYQSGRLILSSGAAATPGKTIRIVDLGERPPDPPEPATAIVPVPATFSLGQNYPNPFNPTTQISYSVPASPGRVTLAVYDILGREVATLVNEVKQPGVYHASWNAADYSSGIYTYRLKFTPLRVGGTGTGRAFSEVKKMVLAR